MQELSKKNFWRHITCLNTVYKIASGSIEQTSKYRTQALLKIGLSVKIQDLCMIYYNLQKNKIFLCYYFS